MLNKQKHPKIFISPLKDTVFKALWLKGDDNTKKYLNRIISYVLGYDISNFDITANELPITSDNSIANKVDVLLESKDKLHKVNIEVNPIRTKTTGNKNISYLFKIAGEFYSGINENKYNNDIHVEQVNLNGFYHEIKDIAIADYKLYDINNNLENKSIKIHDIFLPRMKELCYDNNEIYLDYAMFMCRSFEEMEKYISGNKEKESVMETLKNFVLNKNLPTYDYGEYLMSFKTEYIMIIKEKALQAGFDSSLVEKLERILNEKLDIEILKGIEQGDLLDFEEDILKILEQGSTEAIKQFVEKSRIECIKQRIELNRMLGIKQGYSEGIEQARIEGIEQGKEVNQKEIISKMLKSGLSQKEINKILNIPLDER